MSKNAPEKTPLAIHFIAGGTAGLCEALACHPLGIPTEFFEAFLESVLKLIRRYN